MICQFSRTVVLGDTTVDFNSDDKDCNIIIAGIPSHNKIDVIAINHYHRLRLCGFGVALSAEADVG